MKRRWISFFVAIVMVLNMVMPVMGVEAEQDTESVFSGGDGSENNPYRICNAEQFNAIRNNLDAHYILTDNINMENFENWVPIGIGDGFSGSLEGNGHVVQNLKIVADGAGDYSSIKLNGEIGIFARLNKDARIDNLTLQNIMVTINNQYSYGYVGILAGDSSGNVTNCKVSGFISGVYLPSGGWSYAVGTGGIIGFNHGIIEFCTVENIEGYKYTGSTVGGIAGINSGNIRYCKVGDINIKTSCARNGLSAAGGIVGYNYGGTVNICKSIANVVADVYYAGAAAGGVAGVNSGSISYCFFSGTVKAKAVVTVFGAKEGGIAGTNGARQYAIREGAINNCVSISCPKVYSGSASDERVYNNYTDEKEGREIIEFIDNALHEKNRDDKNHNEYFISLKVNEYDEIYDEISTAKVDIENIGQSFTDKEGVAQIINSLQEPSAMKRITVTKDGYRDYIFYSTIVSKDMVGLFDTNQFHVSLKKKKTGDDTNPYVSSFVFYQNEIAKTCGGQHFQKSDNITFRACGVWNEKQPGYYCLYQEGGESFESQDGIFRLNIGDSFSGNGKIYVKMVAADGTESEPEWVYITLPEGDSELSDDSGVAILNETGESEWLPEVPFLTDDKLSFDLGSLKTTIKRKGSKIQIMLGKEFKGDMFKDEDWEDWKAFCKSQPVDISVSKWMKKWGEILKSDNLNTTWTVGAKIKATGYGWLENDLAADSTTPLTGGIQVIIDASTSIKKQYIVGVVPVYAEVNLGINGNFEGSVTFDMKTKMFDGDNKLKVTPSFSVGAGAGVLYVATVGVEGSASMPVEFNVPKGLTKADLEGSMSLKVSVLGFDYKKEFLKATWPLYNINDKKLLKIYNTITRPVLPTSLPERPENTVSLYDMDCYALPETEAPTTEWYGDQSALQTIALGARSNLQEKLLQTGTSSLTEPMLVQEGDTTLAVFLAEDSSRSTIHRTKLVYTVYDRASSQWSEPKAVSDDGTGDFVPCISADNGRIAVSWLNFADSITDKSDMKQALSSSKVCCALWDEHTGNFVSAGQALSSSASVSYNGAHPYIDTKGDITQVGLKNTGADIFGTSGSNALFMKGTCEGTAIDREFTVMQGLPVSYDVMGNGGLVTAAVCVDTDFDLTTLEDREIWLYSSDGDIKRLTENNVFDSAPQYGDFNGEKTLFWYTDEGYRMLTASGSQSLISADGETAISENFTVVGGESGKTAIVWSAVDKDQVFQLAGYIYDRETGTWSSSTFLSDSEENIFRPSGYYNADGEMEFIYRKGSTVSSGSLYALQVKPAPDLRIIDAYMEDGAETPGETVAVYAGVENTGTEKITGYTIDVDGQKTAGTTAILPGEKALLEARYQVPDTISGRKVPVTVDVEGDYDISNNTFQMSAGYTDFSVYEDEDETENARIVHVNVGNEEGVPGKAVLEVHKDSVDGEMLASTDLGTLNKDDIVTVDFIYQKTDMEYDVDANALYYVVKSDAEEKYDSNNYDYTVFREKKTEQPDVTPTPEPTATPSPKPTATPSPKPAATPSPKPTITPTPKPAATPSPKPTATPTPKPTAAPTAPPTMMPTAEPTVAPTAMPTTKPTASPVPTSQPYLYGDADGDEKITVLDALTVLKYIVGSHPLTDIQKKAADVNGDNDVSVNDALYIIKKVAGSIDYFLVEE